MDPLAPLTALSAYVEHAEVDSLDLEVRAYDARGSYLVRVGLGRTRVRVRVRVRA
jgi:hypothetical protein